MPCACQQVREDILPQLRSERAAVAEDHSSRVPCDQFLEKAEFYSLVGKAFDVLKESSMFDLLLEYLGECGEVGLESLFFCHRLM